MQGSGNLRILFVSAEVSPFAKTGGLADVAGSLPQTLTMMGNDVRIVMPRYKTVQSPMNYVTDFPVQIDWRKETCIVREGGIEYKLVDRVNKVPVYFIDNYHYYERNGIYSHIDDAERFVFFCKAVLDMLPRIDFQPDIIHCNDWHTGPICMLFKEKYKNIPFYRNIASIYTIHNLEYQGHFSKDVLRLLGLRDELFVPDKVEFYGMLNFMKAGLVYADIINTVSERYAREIQTPEYGERLEGLLKERSEDLFGILNGISYEAFNPATDSRIFKNFTEETVVDKKENKYALQREMGLPRKDVPLLGLVSRLSSQKGLDLITDQIDELMKEDLQFVVLGTGDPYYEDAFRNIKLKYPEKVSVYIGFNAALAQRIYAGCDMFLMPSRFEPCGLGQIISLRYGTIPVVRSTGGLADTITDFDMDRENGNGFSFEEIKSEELLGAVRRALRLYNEEPDTWTGLVRRALALDYSWDNSAQKYLKIYHKALEKAVIYNKGK